MKNSTVLESEITCPKWGFKKVELMLASGFTSVRNAVLFLSPQLGSLRWIHRTAQKVVMVLESGHNKLQRQFNLMSSRADSQEPSNICRPE